MKPDMIYVYLSRKPYLLDKGFRQIPIWLTVIPNVCAKFVENTGPYRKLLPLLKEKWNTDEIIITVDDDTIYAPDLIACMVESYKSTGGSCISCRSWFLEDRSKLNMSSYKEAGVNNFHTGKGGVLYTPSMFKKSHDSIREGIFSDEYLKLCKTGDDIWFNLWRIYNNVPCVVIKSDSFMIRDCTNNAFALYKIYNQRDNNKMYQDTYEHIFGAKAATA